PGAPPGDRSRPGGERGSGARGRPPDPARHRAVPGGRRQDGTRAGTGVRRIPDDQGPRRRGGGDRDRHQGGPPGLAAGRGGGGVGGAFGRAGRGGWEVAGGRGLMAASAGLAVQVSFLAVLGVGGARVASGALPVSSLVAFLLYLFLLTAPVRSLINGAPQLQAGLAAVVRLQELERLPVEPRATRRSTRRAWSPGPASVAFTEVWFMSSYPPHGRWAGVVGPV